MNFTLLAKAFQILGIKWIKLQKLIKKGQFKVSLQGKNMMVSKAEIKQYLQECKT